MSKTKKNEDYSWGEILDSFKKGVFGSEDDFDDDDFEEVEVEKDEESKSAEQTDKKTNESAKPAQESVSKPTQKPAEQKSDKGSDSVFCSALQSDLNTFVQTGSASDSLLQLLKEGFYKNPDLLEEIAKYIAVKRRGEERIHPGYFVSFEGEDSMFRSKEKVLDYLLSHPGASVRETIFVSLVKDRKIVDTREATEEEKLYFEQKSSKADASGQEGQDY